MKRRLVFAICVGGLVAAGATRAEAQLSMGTFRGYFTGQVGSATGGSLSNPVFTPGLVVSVQEANGWGAEFDFGHSSDADTGLRVLDVATYMLNGNWIQARGRLRPFASAGVGVMQVDGCDAPCTQPATNYDFGMNAGGGAVFVANDVVGVRGDVRYFRTFDDQPDRRPGHFGFWRVSLGVTFMWAIVP